MAVTVSHLLLICFAHAAADSSERAGHIITKAVPVAPCNHSLKLDHYLAQLFHKINVSQTERHLSKYLNLSVDPCDDFFEFVCNQNLRQSIASRHAVSPARKSIFSLGENDVTEAANHRRRRTTNQRSRRPIYDDFEWSTLHVWQNEQASERKKRDKQPQLGSVEIDATLRILEDDWLKEFRTYATEDNVPQFLKGVYRMITACQNLQPNQFSDWSNLTHIRDQYLKTWGGQAHKVAARLYLDFGDVFPFIVDSQDNSYDAYETRCGRPLLPNTKLITLSPGELLVPAAYHTHHDQYSEATWKQIIDKDVYKELWLIKPIEQIVLYAVGLNETINCSHYINLTTFGQRYNALNWDWTDYFTTLFPQTRRRYMRILVNPALHTSLLAFKSYVDSPIHRGKMLLYLAMHERARLSNYNPACLASRDVYKCCVVKIPFWRFPLRSYMLRTKHVIPRADKYFFASLSVLYIDEYEQVLREMAQTYSLTINPQIIELLKRAEFQFGLPNEQWAKAERALTRFMPPPDANYLQTIHAFHQWMWLIENTDLEGRDAIVDAESVITTPYVDFPQNKVLRIHMSIAHLTPPSFRLHWLHATQQGQLGWALGHELFHAITPEAVERMYATSPQGVAAYKQFRQCLIQAHGAGFPEEMNSNMFEEIFADMMGLRVALRVYRKYFANLDPDGQIQLKHATDFRGRYTREQLFFISMGTTFALCKKKGSPIAEIVQQMRDDHAATKVRLNQMMMQAHAFKEVFQCGDEAPMNVKERCLHYLF